MSIDRARAFFRQFGMEGRILEFSRSSATVTLAAEALGCDPARIAKTLSFLIDGKPVLIVTAGDARVDNARFKARFHCKMKMLKAEDTEDAIGHAVGGVCPFGVAPGVRVFLDQSLRRFETVFPAVGTPNSAIELSIPELERASEFTDWVDVTKAVVSD